VHTYVLYIHNIYIHTQTAGVNSTEPPSSGAGNVHERRLMSQVRRVRIYQCVRSQSGGGASILSPYKVTAIM